MQEGRNEEWVDQRWLAEYIYLPSVGQYSPMNRFVMNLTVNAEIKEKEIIVRVMPNFMHLSEV